MADVPVLVCTAGSLQGRVVHVPEGGLTLGRAEDNDIVIIDDGVSRYHARMLYDGGSLWLRDNGSRNGIFVNGQRVTDHRALKVGDVIAISSHTFAVRWDSETDQDLDGDTEEGLVPEPENRKPWYWPF